MIRYTLRCSKDHRFEAWHRSSDDFEKLAAAQALECPVCGDRRIERAPMAPNVGRKGNMREASPPATAAAAPVGPEAQLKAALRELRRRVEANADYVGPRFATEAEKMHHGEIEHRAIYGETTTEESKRLDDLGVEVQAIPWTPLEDA
mgnify:CR=1 FL=1